MVKTSTEDAEDETAEDEEQAKGSFDLEDGVLSGKRNRISWRYHGSG